MRTTDFMRMSHAHAAMKASDIAYENEQLRQQLAEKDEEISSMWVQLCEANGAAATSQAREQQLREALTDLYYEFERTREWACLPIAMVRARASIALPADTSALEAMIAKAVKESNDRLHEERELWDRKFADGAKKLERLELELDDCLYVLEALWDKQCNKIVTQKWAEILIRNKQATGASSAKDTYHPRTE